jgi:purine-nucleoside phosphorylase
LGKTVRVQHRTEMSKRQPDPRTTAVRLQRLCRLRPTLAIVLGSGFHHVLSELEVAAEIPYRRLPGFPPTGVSGHAGKLLIGRLGETPVMVLGGRAHFYEGHPMAQVTFAVRVLAAYGIRDLLLTNAAGGVNRRFRPGDFMMLTDHINFMGTNPLRGDLPVELNGLDAKGLLSPALSSRGGEGGAARAFGKNPNETAVLRGGAARDLPRFVDLTCAYDVGLRRLLRQAGQACGLRLQTGTYLAVCGPSYETSAEIRAFATLGADAVGMSTVPEVIVARQCGLNVAAVSCITNLAAGRSRATLSHAEVLETGERVKHVAAQLLKNFAKLYGQSQ